MPNSLKRKTRCLEVLRRPQQVPKELLLTWELLFVGIMLQIFAKILRKQDFVALAILVNLCMIVVIINLVGNLNEKLNKVISRKKFIEKKKIYFLLQSNSPGWNKSSNQMNQFHRFFFGYLLRQTIFSGKFSKPNIAKLDSPRFCCLNFYLKST